MYRAEPNKPLVPTCKGEAPLLAAQRGWGHRVGDEPAFARLIENTQRTAVAVTNGQIVGFARGITDGMSNGHLSMVAVSSAHRRMGIGRALVAHVIGADKNITWILRAGRENATAFFSKLGFVTSSVAMERERKRPSNSLEGDACKATRASG